MSNKAVVINGKQVFVPESIMVELGHHEGKMLTEQQSTELIEKVAWLAVKPTPDPLGAAVH